MEFVNEIRRAETINMVENEIVKLERIIKPIVFKLNNMPKEERLTTIGTLLYELLLLTNMTPIEKLGTLEAIKRRI